MLPLRNYEATTAVVYRYYPLMDRLIRRVGSMKQRGTSYIDQIR
jgi:hypothetical protein